MGKNYTKAGITAAGWGWLCVAISPTFGQAPVQVSTQLEAPTQQIAASWRQVGTWVVDQSLAGPAGGPISRVWFAPANSTILVQVPSKRVYQTTDLETWTSSSQTPPAAQTDFPVADLPEPGAKTRVALSDGSRVYAFGQFVYRSDDGGRHWENTTGENTAGQNTTALKTGSLVGAPVHDLAIAPGNEDEIVVGSDAGVFRSIDGGASWISLNDGLPNLPVTRLLSLPTGPRGVNIALNGTQAAEWEPGQKLAWKPSSNTEIGSEAAVREALSTVRGAKVTAVATSGDFVYSGTENGGIDVSPDRGATWQAYSNGDSAGAVQRFWIDPQDSRIAIAVLTSGPHVVRTVNGGLFWDDISGNLPDAPANGVTADAASGVIYVATGKGVYMSYTDLSSLGSAGAWVRLSDPIIGDAGASDARDVQLDTQGNQLWVALNGYGIYSTLAPHRARDPKVVSAADRIARAVAPGSLVSVIGARLDSVRVGDSPAAVLAATSAATEVQIPFDARGTLLTMSATSGVNAVSLPAVTLAAAAPGILVSPDGTPVLLDGDEGVMLDASNPAHSGSRIQILATGLGRTTPEWPAGLAAPLTNPASVTGTVHAYLDREPVEVTRATLAPGYVGFYLIEISVPKIVNYGPAELYVDVDGAESNRVRVYIEP